MPILLRPDAPSPTAEELALTQPPIPSRTRSSGSHKIPLRTYSMQSMQTKRRRSTISSDMDWRRGSNRHSQRSQPESTICICPRVETAEHIEDISRSCPFHSMQYLRHKRTGTQSTKSVVSPTHMSEEMPQIDENRHSKAAMMTMMADRQLAVVERELRAFRRTFAAKVVRGVKKWTHSLGTKRRYTSGTSNLRATA